MNSRNQFLYDFGEQIVGDHCLLLRWEYYPDYPIRLWKRDGADFQKDVQEEMRRGKRDA